MKQRHYTEEEFKAACQKMSKVRIEKEITSRCSRIVKYKGKPNSVIIRPDLILIAPVLGVWAPLVAWAYAHSQPKDKLISICWDLQKELQETRVDADYYKLRTKSKKFLIAKIESRLYKIAFYEELEVDLIPARFHNRGKEGSLISTEHLMTANHHELIEIAIKLKEHLIKLREEHSSDVNGDSHLKAKDKPNIVLQRVKNAKTPWLQAAQQWDEKWASSAERRNALINGLKSAAHKRQVLQSTYRRETNVKVYNIIEDLEKKSKDKLLRNNDLDIYSLDIASNLWYEICSGYRQDEFFLPKPQAHVEKEIYSNITLFQDLYGLDNLQKIIECKEEENAALEHMLQEIKPIKFLLDKYSLVEESFEGSTYICHLETGYHAKIDPEFCCSITSTLMTDPVTNSKNMTYEKKAIEAWYSAHDTDPLTGVVDLDKTLGRNVQLQKRILDFLNACVKDIEKNKASNKGHKDSTQITPHSGP